VIDLRSDTVTKPTAAMRRAMADAEVGDDQYGEDPTVNRLQETAAERFGREAALLCPSGIMCNQIWLRLLARPGTDVVVEADAHLVNYEGGAASLLGGVQFRTVAGRRGLLDPAAAAAAMRPDHFPQIPTSLVCVEQTANRGGGTVYPLEQLAALRKVADDGGASLYMDGARVFNAVVSSGVGPAEYGGLVDGLMFCVSKALGAPVGSLMVGDADAIAEALMWRRRYGGAMRQAGVIAAAGLVAVEQMVDRLAEDHVNARLLAEAVREVHPVGVEADQVQTNIVYVGHVDAAAVVTALRHEGVLAGSVDPRTIRLVTHPDVSADDSRRAADVLRRVLAHPHSGAAADSETEA
jgi:threonine aldolase